MSSLPTPLRRQLESAIKQARKIAESGARHALEALAVHEPDPYRHMDKAQRGLREKLQAQAKQLGDGESQTRRGAYEIKHLAEKLAYDQWHRLLFARYLLENNLLISPEHGVSVTLDDCEELSLSLGLKDAWAVAARFAAKELPDIFRADDPAGAVELPVNDRKPLIQLVTSLPVEVFIASDSLGWCYQFWQAEKKDEVNAAGNKIGADELPAVTQLFTEDYMVDFLLDNTLGAWHAGKRTKNEGGRMKFATEDEARQAVALPGCPWKYLRFVKEPACPAKEPERLAPGIPGQDAPAPFPFLDPYRAIDMHENNLPHWQQGEAWIFVTWRLTDSLPADKLRDWVAEKGAWLRFHPEPWDAKTEREFHERFSARIETWLDACEGSCTLRDPAIRGLVQGALHHFDGERYDLGDFVIMPNHVHALFRPRAGHTLGNILHSWKSFTAKKINEALKKTGSFWQEDYWDRLIRNDRHLAACRHYLAQNPVKAHLRDNEFTLKEPGHPAPVCPERDAPAPLWTPAAGTFDGWPKTTKELKCLDPCMGSGHFVVAMFERLVALRMAEEGSAGVSSAVAAVIRDNLFGLEIDPRCTQIAAFNLALAAWRLVGHCPLPAMNLACSGLAPNTREADWLAIAGDNDKLKNGMARLYRLFQDAPVLGSLINPRAAKGDLWEAGFHELQPLLEKALAQETTDDTTHEMAVTARGLAKAAEILAGQFTLIATNVPYLKNGKHEEVLQKYCERNYANSKGNLACVFVERCLSFCEAGATFAGVVINEMLFLVGYRRLRERLLASYGWQFVAKLGAGAFETITGEVVNVSLIATSRSLPNAGTKMFAIDADDAPQPETKANTLRTADATLLSQKSQLQNPDARITVSEGNKEKLLSAFSDFGKGSVTGDGNHYLRLFWELPAILPGYRVWLNSPNANASWSGREHVVMWDLKDHDLRSEIGHMIRGDRMWGHKGVAICKMSGMDACLYTGELFDDNIGVMLPNKQSELTAIFAFAESSDYRDAIRKIDQAIKVTAATLVKVPFDLAHWQKVAAEKYPHGLPKPFSSDPTQWLFNGHPNGAGASRPGIDTTERDAPSPLHVAMARLLGYRWPRQTGSSFPDCPALAPDGLERLADEDGIVCLSATKGEAPAAERLRALLVQALGTFDLSALLASAGPKGSKSGTLEEWLRDEFFEQHCALFHHRPFIWHIWDGHKSGFSALVNYHQLTHANLEKLTYAYLGDWLRRQQAAVDAGEAGSDSRLQAAKLLQTRLKLILEGEPPYDIFVRWKPLSKQAIGWHPDLNDGVRLNIRPFLAQDLLGGKRGAGILRTKPNIKWEKDRGKEPKRDKAQFPWFWGWDRKKQDFAGVGNEPDGNRWNDCHYSNAVKQAARESRQ